MTDWDVAFQNGAFIPGSELLPAQWAAEAAAFRAGLGDGLLADLPYGPDPRQRLDLILPEGALRGLMVFIHGGYWLAFGKDDWTHLAAGALARGWAVAMVQYRLAPQAALAEMAQDCAAAVTLAAGRVAGPVVLTGHSAGGHLAARLVCDDGLLAPDLMDRIAHVLPISGIFDLRPLLHTEMNADLRLDEDAARAESPALRRPDRAGRRLTLWVGAAERPEFLRQSRLMALIWAGLDADMQVAERPNRHHFNVIADLADPASDLCATLLDGAAV